MAQTKQVALAKAREVKSTTPKKEYRIDPDNDKYWAELAKSRGFRLPQHNTDLTTGGVRVWLTRIGLTGPDFRDWTGGMSLKKFVADNIPLGYNLRMTVGCLLELKNEKEATAQK